MGYIFPSSIGIHLKISILLLAVFVFLILFTSVPQNIFTLIQERIERLLNKKMTIVQKSPSIMIDEIIEKHPAWNRVKLGNIIERMDNYE